MPQRHRVDDQVIELSVIAVDAERSANVLKSSAVVGAHPAFCLVPVDALTLHDAGDPSVEWSADEHVQRAGEHDHTGTAKHHIAIGRRPYKKSGELRSHPGLVEIHALNLLARDDRGGSGQAADDALREPWRRWRVLAGRRIGSHRALPPIESR
jgi:hypothetical protein